MYAIRSYYDADIDRSLVREHGLHHLARFYRVARVEHGHVRDRAHDVGVFDRLVSLAIAKPALDADALVMACCLKTHRYGGHFTLSLKNGVGLDELLDIGGRRKRGDVGGRFEQHAVSYNFV